MPAVQQANSFPCGTFEEPGVRPVQRKYGVVKPCRVPSSIYVFTELHMLDPSTSNSNARYSSSSSALDSNTAPGTASMAGRVPYGQQSQSARNASAPGNALGSTAAAEPGAAPSSVRAGQTHSPAGAPSTIAGRGPRRPPGRSWASIIDEGVPANAPGMPRSRLGAILPLRQAAPAFVAAWNHFAAAIVSSPRSPSPRSPSAKSPSPTDVDPGPHADTSGHLGPQHARARAYAQDAAAAQARERFLSQHENLLRTLLRHPSPPGTAAGDALRTAVADLLQDAALAGLHGAERNTLAARFQAQVLARHDRALQKLITLLQDPHLRATFCAGSDEQSNNAAQALLALMDACVAEAHFVRNWDRPVEQLVRAVKRGDAGAAHEAVLRIWGGVNLMVPAGARPIDYLRAALRRHPADRQAILKDVMTSDSRSLRAAQVWNTLLGRGAAASVDNGVDGSANPYAAGNQEIECGVRRTVLDLHEALNVPITAVAPPSTSAPLPIAWVPLDDNAFATPGPGWLSDKIVRTANSLRYPFLDVAGQHQAAMERAEAEFGARTRKVLVSLAAVLASGTVAAGDDTLEDLAARCDRMSAAATALRAMAAAAGPADPSLQDPVGAIVQRALKDQSPAHIRILWEALVQHGAAHDLRERVPLPRRTGVALVLPWIESALLREHGVRAAAVALHEIATLPRAQDQRIAAFDHALEKLAIARSAFLQGDQLLSDLICAAIGRLNAAERLALGQALGSERSAARLGEADMRKLEEDGLDSFSRAASHQQLIGAINRVVGGVG